MKNMTREEMLTARDESPSLAHYFAWCDAIRIYDEDIREYWKAEAEEALLVNTLDDLLLDQWRSGGVRV